MALIIQTDEPSVLLKAIRDAIDGEDVDTWSYDDNDYFTYTQGEWKNRAWFRAVLHPGELRFTMVESSNRKFTKEVNGIYHGRFVEMLLTLFDEELVSVTAAP